MPPKWSLGYHQCRWSYLSDQRVLEVLAFVSAVIYVLSYMEKAVEPEYDMCSMTVFPVVFLHELSFWLTINKIINSILCICISICKRYLAFLYGMIRAYMTEFEVSSLLGIPTKFSRFGNPESLGFSGM